MAPDLRSKISLCVSVQETVHAFHYLVMFHAVYACSCSVVFLHRLGQSLLQALRRADVGLHGQSLLQALHELDAGSCDACRLIHRATSAQHALYRSAQNCGRAGSSESDQAYGILADVIANLKSYK